MIKKLTSKLTEFVQFIHAEYKGFILSSVLIVVILVSFESFQQYYYILQFDLLPSDQLSIAGIFINHAYRWAIWLSSSLLYFGVIIYTNQTDNIINLSKIRIAIQHFIILILINIIFISSLEIILANRAFSFENFWDNCVFFFFQKAPIYTLSYGAMIGLFYLANANLNLNIAILELKNKIPAKHTKALSIKIGNKNKVIALEDILWIEAYDYCVKIHTTDQHTYAMRNSLKALEKKLQDRHFLRVHRKAIVNMNKVAEVNFNSASFLTLENRKRIDVSQSRVREVKTFYN